MLIDTHAHLTDKRLANNIEEILLKAEEQNVRKIISIGCTIKDAELSIKLAEKYDCVYATAGLYPHDNKEEHHLSTAERIEILKTLIKHPKVKAIGECGLDYNMAHSPEIERSRESQIDLFEQQLNLAINYDLPIIIHSRNATEETLKIARKYKNVPKVWHCFSEGYETAKKALDAGCLISFTGNITYLANEELRECVKKIPMDMFMLETDSPYLIPQQIKNEGVKTNNPSYVKIIAQEVASIKNIKMDLIEDNSSKNAIKFFRLP
jgi:TatD DNase family protein